MLTGVRPNRSRNLDLLTSIEIASFNRGEIERHARGMAQATYLGQSISLCRSLGRYKMFIDTADVGFGSHLLLDGFWESWLTVFMARRLFAGMHVADVGANHGYYTLMIADLVGPSGRVAAIEPNPRMAELLRRSVAINGFADRVEVREIAATALDAQSVWMRAPAHEPKNTHMVASPDAPANAEDKLFEAPGQRLSTVLAGWPRLDFAKIDVEGAEEAAIEGLFPILERDRPDMVLEFNVHRCARPRDLIEKLVSVYGDLQFVDFDSKAHRLQAEAVFDERRTEDWLLFLSRR